MTFLRVSNLNVFSTDFDLLWLDDHSAKVVVEDFPPQESSAGPSFEGLDELDEIFKTPPACKCLRVLKGKEWPVAVIHSLFPLYSGFCHLLNVSVELLHFVVA